MAGNAGVKRAAPFGADLVKIGMADAAIGDGDLHVMFAGRAAFDVDGFQGLIGGMGAIGFHDHDRLFLQGGAASLKGPHYGG